jgi:hypothetical protein
LLFSPSTKAKLTTSQTSDLPWGQIATGVLLGIGLGVGVAYVASNASPKQGKKQGGGK